MAATTYIFKRTPQFRKAFDALAPEDQKAAKESLKIFKRDPFDPALKTHKINRLSALWRRNVWSVTIKGNLRAVFCMKSNQIISLDIGTHDIYK